MLGAPIPPELQDTDPPALTGDQRRSVDHATDTAARDAVAAAFA